MASGGSPSSTFSLPSPPPRHPKTQADDYVLPKCGEDDLLTKIFRPRPGSLGSSRLGMTLPRLDWFLNSEMSKIAGRTKSISKSRDGLLGPDEIKLTGSALYEADRLGITGQGNFSTVKANACVFSGKWMFEVLLGSKGLMQIGWCSLGCKFNHSEGVGDTPHSFSYDGNRIRKWNVKTQKYGESWMTGDVISCCMDCDEGTITFYRNGSCMGVAFENIPLGPGVAYFPAVSLSSGENVRLNFGNTPFIYPLDEYRPMQIAPLAQLQQSDRLLEHLASLLEEYKPTPESETATTLLMSHVLEYLVPRIKLSYIIQGSFIPFLKNIVETKSSEKSDELIDLLIRSMWGLMEDHEIKLCVENIIHGLLTLYRFSSALCHYLPQKSYLTIMLKLMEHKTTRKYSLKYLLFDKMKFPLFIYIKPPDDSVLAQIIPTVWWQSAHVKDKIENEAKKAAYYKSCADLTTYVRAIEDIQVLILKQLLKSDDGNRSLSSRYMFLLKLRELLRENLSESGLVQGQKCSYPVLLALFHRLVRTLRELIAESKIPKEKVYTSSVRFADDSIDYFDLNRLGGLYSFLSREHRDLIRPHKVQALVRSPECDILGRNSPDHNGGDAEDSSLTFSDELTSLVDLLDSCVVVYMYGAHKQLNKMSSVLTEGVDCFISGLNDTLDKLKKCPPEETVILAELQRSRDVFEQRVEEQSRQLSWLIAVINSPEKLNDLAFVFEAALRTMERADSEWNGELLVFTPELYLNVCVNAYTALKNFFKLSTQPFTQHEDYEGLLKRYGILLAKHFSDSRIVSMDTKDSVVQSLACFVCYENSLRVIEALPDSLRLSMVRSLLEPYENRTWAQTNWILARLWKGAGFAFRFIHLPHLSPIKQQQEIGAASLQKPCPSAILQRDISTTLQDDNKMATQFINSLLNSLNWAFSEFVGMIQELQQLSVRSERRYVEIRQLRICATCFDISVGLLRVLEMVVSVAPNLFLTKGSGASGEETSASAELLTSRLFQSLCTILNRVSSKSNIFDLISTLSLPGMESVELFPIVTALLGIIVSITLRRNTGQSAMKAQGVDSPAAQLVRDPGFRLESVSRLLEAEKPTEASGGAIVPTETDRFILSQYKEISSDEIQSIRELINVLQKEIDKHQAASTTESTCLEDDDDVCTICYDKPKSIRFVPCSHTSCRQCISHQMLQNSKCFFCMSEITGVTTLDGKVVTLC